jgi:adenylate cyclase
VIARNSSFQYRGKALDIKRVGRDLGVQYVVEGSVQRGGSRARITAQLNDALSGAHLWAERYDRDLQDVFAVQDEVVQKIVATLVFRVETTELDFAKRRPPQDVRAYDLCLRGEKCLDLWSPDANTEAHLLFSEAIKLEPSYARAYAGLAATSEWASWYSAWPKPPGLSKDSALLLARKAVELDDTDVRPHITLAWAYHMRRDFGSAKRHLDRALALNPNDADALANRAMILIVQGEPHQGIECALEAIRLNPSHPDWYYAFLGSGYFFIRDFGEAMRLGEMMKDAPPDAMAFMAAIYAMANDSEKAAEFRKRFVDHFPQHWSGDPSGKVIVDLFSFKRDDDAQLLLEGLRKAGIPD